MYNIFPGGIKCCLSDLKQYRMLKCRDKTRFTYLSAAAASIEPADDEGTEFTNAALYEHG